MNPNTETVDVGNPFIKWETASEIAAGFVNGKSNIVDVRVYDNYAWRSESETLIFFFVLNSVEVFNHFANLVKHCTEADVWFRYSRRVHRLNALNLLWGDLYPSWHKCTTYHGRPLENSVDVMVLPPNWPARLTELCEKMNYGTPKLLQIQWDKADSLIHH
jgi:hypothetical protein